MNAMKRLIGISLTALLCASGTASAQPDADGCKPC